MHWKQDLGFVKGEMPYFEWDSLVGITNYYTFSLAYHQSEKEIVGTLRGFDEYVNMVLDEVTEIENTPAGRREVSLLTLDRNIYLQ